MRGREARLGRGMPVGPGGVGQLRFGNMTQIHDLSATELVSAVRARELSPVAITDHYLSRIEEKNATVARTSPSALSWRAIRRAAAEKAVVAATTRTGCHRSSGCRSRSRI